MINLNPESSAAERSRFVECGGRLEYFTIFWNSLEALAVLIAGFIAVTSLMVLPLLSRAKRCVAMAADARQTDFCTYLSGILLGGLLLKALFGLWWADPVAGLVMVLIIAKEGIAGGRARRAVIVLTIANHNPHPPTLNKPVP